jgi:hypothetical protein
MRMPAIYARVSSEQQREENMIASHTASLLEFAHSHELEVPKEWVFEDDVGVGTEFASDPLHNLACAADVAGHN